MYPACVCLTALVTHFFFFFNDTATTEIYTLSLHDALPIFEVFGPSDPHFGEFDSGPVVELDRKSTRLNSSHHRISYAVFCLKKKKEMMTDLRLGTRVPRRCAIAETSREG